MSHLQGTPSTLSSPPARWPRLTHSVSLHTLLVSRSLVTDGRATDVPCADARRPREFAPKSTNHRSVLSVAADFSDPSERSFAVTSNEIPSEPHPREFCDALERARLFEQVRGAWYDFERFGFLQPLEYFLVDFDDDFVVAADDEQRRRDDAVERSPRQIGPTSARHHRTPCAGPPRRGDQRRSSAGARAEQPDAKRSEIRVGFRPVDGADESVREQRDVEAKLCRHGVGVLFIFGEEIQQQRGQPSVMQHVADASIRALWRLL